MIVTALNNKEYEIRINGTDLEIERAEESTGLRKVFVFQDLAIGNKNSSRKETVFYCYDITPTGERINKQRRSFTDNENEFSSFEMSAVWETLCENLVSDFFIKIEGTSLPD